VVPGNANEAVRTDAVLAAEPTPRPPGAVIIGDGLYNNATTVAQVEAAGGRPCVSGLKAERVSDAFTYEAGPDQMGCREGKRSVGKVRVDQGDLYYFSMRDCVPCPRAATCLTRGEREGRAEPRRPVYLSDVRKARVMAGEAGRAWRQAHAKLRPRIEAKFDEQMNRHGLRHARDWGLAKVTAQILLNALTVNAKRAGKLLALPCGRRRRRRSRCRRSEASEAGSRGDRPGEGRIRLTLEPAAAGMRPSRAHFVSGLARPP
jgi:hypothetical protein